VVVEVEGKPVTIVVAHPPPPSLRWNGVRNRPGTAGQIASLIETITTTEGPLLLLGDFNVTRLQEGYRRFVAAGLQDVFIAAGRGAGWTIPTRFAKLATNGHPLGRVRLPPLLRIDYIWATPHWQPLDAWVGPGAGSDHLPVLATLDLS
jgi:endonuclease/exonuclease/phosphatase (EEP) superfamily protein YafD